MSLFFNSDGTPAPAALLLVIALIILIPGLLIGHFTKPWAGVLVSIVIAAALVALGLAIAKSFGNG